MENVKGRLVVAFTKEREQIFASVDIKGLASGGRLINVIPVLLDDKDASLIAAHCWENNDNIEDIAIVDISSLFSNNKPVMRLISNKLHKPTKKWYQFWRKS